MIKNMILFIVCSFILCFSTSYAQEAKVSSGGEGSGSGGSVSYSVGQVVYTYNTGTNGSVDQGVQQPYEISVVTGIEETEDLNISVSTYPNPTSDYLTLSVDEIDISNLSYQVYDMKGRLLQNKEITSSQTTIIMGDLIPATYFLKVTDNKKEFKIFKIIKN